MVPCTIESERKKYLCINLTKEIKDLLCTEHYRRLTKETEEDTQKMESYPTFMD